MRDILIVGLILFGATTAQARCAGSGVSFWPTETVELPTRPLILVEGFARDQATIQNLKGAFLKSRKHQVPLEVLAHHDGAMRVSQIVLQATEDLKPGRTYQLWLQGKNKAWRPTRWIDGGKKRVQWRAGTRTTKVTWTALPTVSDGYYTEFGCGPAVDQAVKLPVTNRSGVVKVELSGPKTSRTYLVPMPAKGPLRLGHNMCSGPFDVQSVGEYSASLTPIDSAGVQGQVHRVNFSAVSSAR